MEMKKSPPMLIDTHCHVYLEEFDNDRNEVIQRAREAGVARIFMPALDKNHFLRLLDVETAYPGVCRAMAGIHPCYVNENYREELDFLQVEVGKRPFAAIGEIGLDYYWDRTFDDFQMICFREQIDIALSASLPIVIHSRSSMDAVIGVLKEYKGKGLRGIFHCFSGTYENAVAVIDCGLLLGIGGVVTYKNAGLAEVVSKLDLRHIVVETDAPYLAPVPFRGKRNESSYLKYVVQKISEVAQEDIEQVAEITTANALKVFNEPF